MSNFLKDFSGDKRVVGDDEINHLNKGLQHESKSVVNSWPPGASWHRHRTARPSRLAARPNARARRYHFGLPSASAAAPGRGGLAVRSGRETHHVDGVFKTHLWPLHRGGFYRALGRTSSPGKISRVSKPAWLKSSPRDRKSTRLNSSHGYS